MQTENYIEQIRLKATALSPVHIGSYQQALEMTDYLVHNRRVYVCDSSLVFGDDKLVSQNELNHWINGYPRSLTAIYNEKRGAPGLPAPERMALYSLTENGGLSGNNQYRPFIRNGFGKAYFPGSSLKGAIRNAWLYHFLNLPQNAPLLKNVATELGKAMQLVDERKLNNPTELFNRALPPNLFRDGFGVGNPGDIQADLFRAISLSDGNPLEDSQLAAERVEVLCYFERYFFDNNGNIVLYRKPKLTIIEECLQERQSFQFTLSMNTRLLELYAKREFAPQSTYDLLDRLDDFFRVVWKFDNEFFKPGEPDPTVNRLEGEEVIVPALANFYANPPASPTEGQRKRAWLMRVGAGSGLHSVTPTLRLKPEDENEDQFLLYQNDPLRFLIGYYAFWDNKFKADVFPKSRKVIARQSRNTNQLQYTFPTGWLLLEEITDD